MQIKKLFPEEIITLNDFPVFNEQILKIFYRIYQKGFGRIIPACPILNKDWVIPSFDKKLKDNFRIFELKNPKAKYFLLDGSHRTTAATLTNNKIKVMIFENNKDIKHARRLVEIGELFSLSVKDSIEGNIKILIIHFNKKSYFETVKEKAERMINERVIPFYIIKGYNKKI